ncbi:uncharacterized protein [Gossypium hirsutum]|uniref:Uncharacterized protein isoform X1 n=1 Tax=Gossypium hirsutum TaxID=3635 RepID=A0ABM2YI83_GOSHI|nr:uncharacterized protein LOC121204483 isoform X1 [Gossypium hirsutum]
MKACVGWRRFLFCFPLIFILPHLFSGVLELHQNQAVTDSPKENTKKFDVQHSSGDDAPKKITKKFDHLVLGPAAGEGLPNRLQCRGVKALNKTYFSNPSHASSVGDGIAFVTVFTIYNNSPDALADGKPSNLVTVGNASYSKPERSMAILNVFIKFIQVTLQLNMIELHLASFWKCLLEISVKLLEVQDHILLSMSFLTYLPMYFGIIVTRGDMGWVWAQTKF